MNVKAPPFRAWLSGILLLMGVVYSARGQHVEFRTVEQTETGFVVEVAVDWAKPMTMIIDSTGIASFTPAAARALAMGVLEASETYTLPSLHLPRAAVIASEYDEIRLPAGDGDLAPFEDDLVYLAGLGVSRKVPQVNLVSRLLTYESGTVRRYRKLRVSVSYARAETSSLLSKTAAVDNPHLDVSESVLANGVVYKIPITAEGIYRIDRAFLADLPGLGLSPDEIDPDNIKIYGNGGRPVPALNAAPRSADLVENPAYRTGGGDGRFDAGDAVLFYGAAPRGWTYNAATATWEHYVHPFSSENYYFIKIDDDKGESVGEAVYPGFSDAEVLTRAEGRFFRDFDEFIWSKENGSGHTWVSRTIRTGTRGLLENQTLPGLAGGDIDYEVRVAIRSNPAAHVIFESITTRLAEERARRTVTPDVESPAAAASIARFSQEVGAGEPVNVSMRLDPEATGAPEAAVDWIRAFYTQRLEATGDTLRFATPGGRSGRFEMVLSGFSSAPQVWDVTDPGGIRRLGVLANGSSHRVQMQVDDASKPRELIAFSPERARAPVASTAQRVASQNLHGLANYPEFVIVTAEPLRSAAEALADYRAEQGMRVIVVDIQKIYNEFSGGLQDMRAARDYFKFLYDRAPDDARRLRYALLFGDGHYNFRNLGDETQRPDLQSWIPPFETEESFDPVESYTSDDYFGLLDDGEGIWSSSGPYGVSIERMDVGIGRIPVQTPEEAAAMVDKIKRYENPETYGAWRNRYLFVADDGYNGTAGTLEDIPDLHTQNVDVVADLIRQQYPKIDVKKIYAISYTRVFQNGNRIPGAARDILSSLDDGVLVMNYAGHGGEYGLAQEEIFTREDAAALQNGGKLPVFVTATCSFGWWDLGREQSGAEVLMLNPNGGAIALMTTVRLVYTSQNINTLNVGLNRMLTSEMFKRDENGLPRRLGDIMLSTKNTAPGLEGNNRKFNLLGDPTLRLGVAPRETVVETINGEPVSERPKLSALDRITVTGSVRGLNGGMDAAFDGRLHLTVFDAERRVQLSQRSAMPQDYYRVREDLIWRGIVPVRGGRFEATFVVPKDISYSDDAGRISAYAYNGTTHAGGFTENITVGGTSANPPNDQAGPEIRLFLNDTTFVAGGMTKPTPKLIVKLEDESGINAVGAGVGHEMLLVVDGDEQRAVDISARFESDPNSYQSGTATFSFENYPGVLDDGRHRLSVRAWDVLNNSAASELDFFVSSVDDLVLRNVYNYPNPTSGRTRFIFDHNQPTGTSAEVQIRIYTLAGRPIRTMETDESLPSGILTAGPVQVLWDGRDEDLNLVASGIYLYKVRVAVDGSDGERHVSEQIEKIAVIR